MLLLEWLHVSVLDTHTLTILWIRFDMLNDWKIFLLLRNTKKSWSRQLLSVLLLSEKQERKVHQVSNLPKVLLKELSGKSTNILNKKQLSKRKTKMKRQKWELESIKRKIGTSWNKQWDTKTMILQEQSLTTKRKQTIYLKCEMSSSQNIWSTSEKSLFY